jgi:hypothetical protein
MACVSHELRTFEEFESVRRQKVGVIVVTDTPTGTTKAHKPDCSTISVETFSAKALPNGGKNGRYYYFLRLWDAQRELGAEVCRTCAPPSN